MSEYDVEYMEMYWQKVVGNRSLRIDLGNLKSTIQKAFKIGNVSDNYKQKLVYNLLETVKDKDQNRFFYILLKAINKPKENLNELWEALEKDYDVMPEEAFINFAYSIILGIMATYGGGKNE